MLERWRSSLGTAENTSAPGGSDRIRFQKESRKNDAQWPASPAVRVWARLDLVWCRVSASVVPARRWFQAQPLSFRERR